MTKKIRLFSLLRCGLGGVGLPANTMKQNRFFAKKKEKQVWNHRQDEKKED